ncbi:MAG TPA: hypothetical protein VMH81_28895 [Bryobacteraceae bacterium]|nr:hypothetical protein [Bryobacteraceae bacterium]
MTEELEILAPVEPETIEQTGLPESMIEELVLKVLYFRNDLYGQDLSVALGLKFSVIQDVIDTFKLQHLVQVKRSMGMGNVGAVLALTEAGRARAREVLENNLYAGPAPVPIEQYAEMVRQQRPREGWLTKEGLAKALRGMVVTERMVSQLGPAVSSANTLLLYGKPGDGKTFLIESLANLETSPIFIPYALESQGNIIQMYDPIYHQRLEEEEPSVLTVSVERSYDKRWAKCKRPFIVSGGELSLDMLDLRYNTTSKINEAPFQLKANNGIYLIDDFGRQRATPAEVLNRWIVPMERRVDYLSFPTGGKMTVPFESFLVFSTNLNPNDLGDEAFLRRIQYKLLVRSPGENEFIRIFESFCATRRIPVSRELIKAFIDKHYRAARKPFRRCHPRDVLGHALNLIHFEKLPLHLTPELLDRAYESCFVQEPEDQAPVVAEAPIMPLLVKSCSDFWGDKVALINTAFGSLVFTASFRDRAAGRYHDVHSARQYGEAETSRVLQRLHQRAFLEWLALSSAQQIRDLTRYFSSPEGNAAKNLDPRDLLLALAPAEARPEENRMFIRDLGPMLEQFCQRPAAPAAPLVAETPAHISYLTPVERIA